MKKTGTICLWLSLFLVFYCLCMPAAAVSTDPNSDTDTIFNGDDTPILGTAQLITNAEAVVLYERTSNTLMYSWNGDSRVYPASLVKIMTALIAAQQGNMTDVVTVSEAVLSTVPYDAVSADLVDGELLTLEQLLYCMMVGSANDAAAVIADHIAGSQEAFVALMNARASELGCIGTYFTNVHGLHDEQQYTTAKDIALILAAALENEAFRTFFSAISYTVPATNKSEERVLTSGNYLMNTSVFDIYYDARVTGGRTGTADDGGRCMAVSAEGNGLQLVSVIMGAKSIYEEDGYTVRSYGGFSETKALLDIGLDGYKAVQILHAGQALKQLPVVGGANDVTIGPTESAATVLPVGVTVGNLAYQYTNVHEQITAPVKSGEKLAHVKVFYGSTCVAQADLFAMNSVSTLTAAPSQEQPLHTDFPWAVVLAVILAVLGVAAVMFAVLFLIRRARIAAAKKRSRRYRRGRRRSR